MDIIETTANLQQHDNYYPLVNFQQPITVAVWSKV
jgi:hypothetical protein